MNMNETNNVMDDQDSVERNNNDQSNDQESYDNTDQVYEPSTVDAELEACSHELIKTKTDFANFKRHIEADFANFKRRVEKERFEWSTSAQVGVISAFLPFIEDFNRALETSEQHPFVANNVEAAAWLEGFKLISKSSAKALQELGVTEIDCLGVFNPELHEALMQVESQDKPSGSIVHVFSKGYMFKGNVVRHARVSVAQ